MLRGDDKIVALLGEPSYPYPGCVTPQNGIDTLSFPRAAFSESKTGDGGLATLDLRRLADDPDTAASLIIDGAVLSTKLHGLSDSGAAHQIMDALAWLIHQTSTSIPCYSATTSTRRATARRAP